MRPVLEQILLREQDIFRDDFNGPLSSRWAKTDTESKISEAGGKLLFAGGKALPSLGDPRLTKSNFRRQAGLALEYELTPAGVAQALAAGWLKNEAGAVNPGDFAAAFIYNGGGGDLQAVASAAAARSVGTFAASSARYKIILGSYDVANQIISSNGGLFYQSTDGGVTWKVLWRDAAEAADPLFVGYSNYNMQFDSQFVRVFRHLFPMPKVYDSANRPDSAISAGTSDSGHGYTAVSGIWGISGNKIYRPGQVAGWDVLGVNSGLTDGLFGADVTVDLAVHDWRRTGLGFRIGDASNFWFFGSQANAPAGSQWNLMSYVAAVETVVGVATEAITDGQVYSLAVLVVGNSIRCYVDGVQKISVSNAALASNTSQGFIKVVGGSLGRWDNFLVQGGLPA